MSRKEKTKPVSVYQLKITLKEIKPPIWRRVQVRGDIPLDILHYIFQICMGWLGGHLHEFRIGNLCFGEPDPDFDSTELFDEVGIQLDQIVPRERSSFLYLYDFGDGWEHRVIVEKIVKPQPDVQYPVCLDGKRACPPEDCGGSWGYDDLLKAINDPNHPEHEELLEWVGGSFDPEEFDLDIVNEELRNFSL